MIDERLVGRAADGDESAAMELFDRHRDRLRQMVVSRMDRRLSARLDPSDVLQEALMIASKRLPEYRETQQVPFYVWLRQITLQSLFNLHRTHFTAEKRSIRREVTSQDLAVTDESIGDLADQFVDSLTGPSEGAMRKEMNQRVRTAIRSLSEIDREIIELRYLEMLSNEEIAAVLGVTTTVVHTRHFRAIQRLSQQLHHGA